MKFKLRSVLAILLIFVITSGLLMIPYETQGDSAFPGGDGTVDDPFWITTADELNEVRNFLDQHFIIKNDIDLNIEPYNTGEGWVPIGGYSATPFTGSLDGDHYKISNLMITSNGRFQGLFGYVKNATITSVNLENVNISYEGNQPQSAGDMIGALAGLVENSNISHVTASGTIIKTDFVGGLIGTLQSSTLYNSSANVDLILPRDSEDKPITLFTSASSVIYAIDYARRGGLVGNAVSFSSPRSMIINSFATGDVEGIDYAGGLIGNGSGVDIVHSYAASGTITAFSVYNEDELLKQSEWIGGLAGSLTNTTVLSSYSHNEVTTDGEKAGGFVGLSSGSSYTNNYSRSNVTGSSEVAGFIAAFADNNEINNAYSAGTVNVEGPLYGFAPEIADGDITYVIATDVFFDSNLNVYDEIKLEPDNELAAPLSTIELKSQNTFIDTEWNLGGDWDIDLTINDGYPYLVANGLAVTSTDLSGAENDSNTKVTVTESVSSGHKLVYKNFETSNLKAPRIGDELTGYSDLPDNGVIPASNGDKIGLAEIYTTTNQVMRFGQVIAVVTAEQGPTYSDPPTSTPANNVEVIVNGKVENMGKATTTEVGGVKTTTIVVDPIKLQTKLDDEGSQAVVIIPVNLPADVIIGELNGQIVKNMENASAQLVLQTNQASYTLPAMQINIDAISKQVGESVALEDIKIQIEIGAPTSEMIKVVENTAVKGSYSIVVPPVEFTVRGVYGNQSIEVTRFNAYVERTIAIPDGVDPSKITTGVVIDLDGTERHVPTKVVEIEGKYFAVINSLTNSTYSVVWHPIEFIDVTNHWAQHAVNDMGSRMVIDGTGNGMFSPDRDITRGEFAAIIVRGLGLKLENGGTPFIDVKPEDWYSKAVNTAYTYNLISGFGDGTFRPHETISREQAMVILSKAMSITRLKAKLSVSSADDVLRPYKDAADVSSWAISSVTDNVHSGVVSGRTNSYLAPKATITRAEVATMVRSLLKKSGLI